MLRIENIGDKFDTDYNSLTRNQTTVNFALDQFARDLFARANWKNKGFNLT